VLTSLAPPAQAAGRYGSGDFSFLASRAVGAELSIANPGFGYDACFGLCSEKQLYYPEWMEGEWSTSSVLSSKIFPLGEELVYRNLRKGSARSEQEAIGQETIFRSKYVPVEEKKRRGNKLCAIADRSFNTAAMLNAYAGYSRISSIKYEPARDPTRMLIEYPLLGPDMRPLPPKRTEVFINNRDAAISSSSPSSFACSELFRAVTIGPGSVAVADSENACLYTLEKEGQIRGRQRNLVYLVPNPNSKEGDLYMQTKGRAVAIYEYAIEMKRV